jgi:hypothetical protein
MNKIALVTTAWLDNDEYRAKTIKFVEYYKQLFDVSDIYIIDNGSVSLRDSLAGAKVLTQYPRYERSSHLDYKYLWRAVYSLKYFFEMDYQTVIYMDNDFFVCSKDMFEWMRQAKGWNSVYCSKHNFPETGMQIISSDSITYKEFVKDGEFWKHNGKCMETTLPVIVNKDFTGDRYSERGITTQDITWQYSAQTALYTKVVLR